MLEPAEGGGECFDFMRRGTYKDGFPGLLRSLCGSEECRFRRGPGVCGVGGLVLLFRTLLGCLEALFFFFEYRIIMYGTWRAHNTEGPLLVPYSASFLCMEGIAGTAFAAGM